MTILKKIYDAVKSFPVQLREEWKAVSLDDVLFLQEQAHLPMQVRHQLRQCGWDLRDTPDMTPGYMPTMYTTTSLFTTDGREVVTDPVLKKAYQDDCDRLLRVYIDNNPPTPGTAGKVRRFLGLDYV